MKGDELLRLLNKIGMSRRELGRELGIADTTIGRWIKNRAKIGPLEAAGLHYYFGAEHGLVTTWKGFKGAR